ncbi:MAG TPA: SMP-30/gluconolactonase/LRE family protein, partial [Armatimonadota bacterium]|nr:SMP-30/gluconolactonase/LRE family protein [Armatimonadota bacterium]
LDIPAGRMFRYEPATGRHEECYHGGVVGGTTLQADGALLLFMARGAVKTWRDGTLSTVLDEIPEERDSRFNDVIADPEGRVFCGTMSSPHHGGRLYRLDPDGRITRLLDGLGTPNGMGFTADLRRMYFTDSGAHSIYLFDYDRETGGISNQRVFLKTPDGEGAPDGMTLDSEGFIWSARWDGWSLFRYTPDAHEDRRIRFPAKKVSSATFGGEDLTDLYVTTAGGNNREENGPSAGALFRLRPGVRGVPEFRSRVRL